VEMGVGLRQDCGDRSFVSALEVFPGHDQQRIFCFSRVVQDKDNMRMWMWNVDVDPTKKGGKEQNFLNLPI
jgi:hypothetical protein